MQSCNYSIDAPLSTWRKFKHLLNYFLIRIHNRRLETHAIRYYALTTHYSIWQFCTNIHFIIKTLGINVKSASNGISNYKTYFFKKSNSGTIDQFLLLVLEGHCQQTPHNFEGRSSWNHSILPAYFSILTILLNIAWTLSGQYFGGRRKSRYHIDCACVSLYICQYADAIIKT